MDCNDTNDVMSVDPNLVYQHREQQRLQQQQFMLHQGMLTGASGSSTVGYQSAPASQHATPASQVVQQPIHHSQHAPQQRAPATQPHSQQFPPQHMPTGVHTQQPQQQMPTQQPPLQQQSSARQRHQGLQQAKTVPAPAREVQQVQSDPRANTPQSTMVLSNRRVVSDSAAPDAGASKPSSPGLPPIDQVQIHSQHSTPQPSPQQSQHSQHSQPTMRSNAIVSDDEMLSGISSGGLSSGGMSGGDGRPMSPPPPRNEHRQPQYQTGNAVGGQVLQQVPPQLAGGAPGTLVPPGALVSNMTSPVLTPVDDGRPSTADGEHLRKMIQQQQSQLNALLQQQQIEKQKQQHQQMLQQQQSQAQSQPTHVQQHSLPPVHPQAPQAPGQLHTTIAPSTFSGANHSAPQDPQAVWNQLQQYNQLQYMQQRYEVCPFWCFPVFGTQCIWLERCWC